ncbi:MAG TPA: PKD domain-containing protein [Candidatus Acidoferrales bacterium]
MRILRDMGLTLFLALFLISSCFADDAKNAGTDKKDQPAADGHSTPASKSDASTAPASPATPTPAAKPAKPAPPPQRSRPEDSSEQVPKYVPMPALDGNPGLFTLETGDTLPAGALDLSIGVNKFSRMPGNITVLQTVPAFGMGFNRWFSVFFQIAAGEHIHVDQPSQLSLNDATLGFPQYRNTIYRSILPGTGIAPAYVEDFPFASHNGGGVGELDLGFKIGLLSEKRGKPFSLSLRNDFFIPTSSGLSDLLRNEVQYGRFNYGIGLEASKTILHNSMLITLNWSYRFRPGEKFSTIDLLNLPGPPTAPTPISPAVLNLSDEMGVGAGMLVFPGKRFQILTEYTGLIYVRSGIQNTTFGGRDPVDTTTGIRFYPIRRIALDVGYRYSLSLLNHQDRNGFIVKLAGAYWPEKPREPDQLTSSCSADKSSVVEGSNAAVQTTATATDSWGHPLTYTWTANGGKITNGTSPYARWDSEGVAPGTYALSLRVDDGTGKTSSCSTNVRVDPKPKPPAPTMSCSADRSSVAAGERAQITATVNDQSNTALRYSWQASGGQIVGATESSPSVQFDSSGLAPGTYTVTGRVENGAGGAADCSTSVTVQQPPAPPQASKISDCSFRPGSARVDNVCKRVLDDAAVRLQSDPKAKVVLVGFADPKEPGAAKLASRRADEAKKYLAGKQGIDGSRVDVRSSTGTAGAGKENRRVDVVLVPDGATY